MLYEVPYNFDESLIPFYQKYASYINFVYLPPYKEDSDNTRTVIQTNRKGCSYMPLTRREYEKHLNMITNAGLKFVVLWQVYNNIISRKTLKYYCELDASGFVVANDQNAEIIKKYNSKLIVICSIVQRLCSNVTQKDLHNYDYVVLYYPFNRSLRALEQLHHIKDKIVLMPNTFCNVNCPSVHHWFPSIKNPFNPKKDCPTNIKNIDSCGVIFPEHLKLFDNLVGGYKLQGREYSASVIKYICHFYFMRTQYKDFIAPFLSEDMAHALKDLISNTPLEEYYNTKTPEIIDFL